MHGYPLEAGPEMEGNMLLWRYPDALGPHELGAVSVLQIEPTVAHLLGISPAPQATGQPFQ